MDRHLIRTLVALALVGVLAACGGDDGGTAADQPSTGGGDSVSVLDNNFEPADLSVSVGDTVTWTHDGAASHTVTADDGSFDSGNISEGDTFEHTFDEAGEFPYLCEIHTTSMTGTITVS
jgi:plastocyanin